MSDLFTEFEKAIESNPNPAGESVAPAKPPSPWRRYMASLIIVGMTATFLYWASRAEVETVVRATGQVIPDSSKQIIQSLDGGIISQIPVKEGQIVKKGDIILTLDDKRYSAIHESNVATRDAILARLARLEAEASGAESIAFPPLLDNETLKAAEKNLFEARREDLQTKLDFKERLLGKERERLATSIRAFNSGALPKTDRLSLEAKIIELEEALQTLTTEFRRKALEEHDRSRERLAALVSAMKADEDRMERTVIHSPIDGIINQIHLSTIGRVVGEGEAIMEIIPRNDSLVIEARIRPADIAFLHQGQPVNVVFTAYDFSIYGGLEGKVTTLGVDTVLDQVTNDVYYPVKVETEQKSLGNDSVTDEELELVPGMIAEVNILTGKRTILDYLLKPILKTQREALRER